MLEIDEGLRRPQARAQLVACDKFPGLFKQDREDLERLFRKRYPVPAFRSSPERKSSPKTPKRTIRAPAPDLSGMASLNRVEVVERIVANGPIQPRIRRRQPIVAP